MKDAVRRIVGAGVDVSTRKALKSSMSLLGIKEENIDRMYINVKNSVNRKELDEIPVENRALFLPHCLRPAELCRARVGEYGYECNGCSLEGCKIAEIRKEAENRGYRVFIVPGGSMVYNIMKKEGIKGMVGVACIKESVDALENIDIPAFAVELSKSGCVNTDVSVRKVIGSL